MSRPDEDRLPTTTLRGVCVHHVDADGTWWGLRGRHVLRGRGASFTEVSAFPRQPVDVPSRVRVVERLLRTDQALLWPSPTGRLLGIRLGSAWDLSDSAAPRRLFDLTGRSPLRGGAGVDASGRLIFGEYSSNRAREGVRLFRVSPDLDRHEIVHTFAPGEVRHVHTVRMDPYDTDTIWVTTGDLDGECFLMQFDATFREPRIHGDGSQMWRAVALLFTESHVIWCTDSELEQNIVRRMDRTTGQVEEGGRFPAPVYQGVRTSDGLYLCCTTAERGPGVQTDRAQLWTSPDGWRWSPALSWKRDRLSGPRLRWGILSLPGGAWSSEQTWVHGLALRGLDDTSAAFDLSDRLT